MMCGLEKPDEGEIKRSSKISFPLGFMGGLNQKHTAIENCRYIAKLYGLDSDYVEAFCRYLCNLDEYFEMPVATYSKGMKARFMLALLLALEFDIYLIDEGMPQSTDAEFNRKAGSVLRDRLTKSTVVIVSHQAEILEAFCDTAAVLRDGKLLFFDTLEEAKQVYNYAQ
jgi:capsular polysaccharide transport system ATP-binding protein